MQSKLILVLAALLALSSVNAQGDGAPALSSLSSKIKSISVSDNSPARPTHLASAESAFSRISSALQKSASAIRSGASSAIISAASSASAVSSSAAAAQSSAASASASVSASASASATAGASSGAAITVVDNTLFVQCSALAALFIASFIAILA